MIIDLSKNKKEDREKIQELVGKPYSWLNRLKLGGIGSSRMQLSKYSTGFSEFFSHTHSNIYANIEIRPKGIIVHFKKYQTHLGWVVPFYKLTMYQSEYLSLHAEGQFLKFNPVFLKQDHKRFFKKLSDVKNDFLTEAYLFI